MRTRTSKLGSWAGIMVGALAGACTGSIKGAEDEIRLPGLPPAGSTAPNATTTAPPAVIEGPIPCKPAAAPQPGPSPLRRLTRFEYNNTVRDLLGDNSQPASVFPPEERVVGFFNNAQASSTSQLLVERYIETAEKVAGRAMTNLGALMPCMPSAGEDTCAHQFIETF